MDLVSIGPLTVASLLWQPRAGAWIMTVACKATYVLAQGECPLAQDQEPINDHDEHWNDDARRSVRAPNELVPTKMRGDVIVSGHAFAPGGAPVRSLVTRVTVGDVDKAIEVVSDRVITLEGAMQEGARFTRMPLTYERAAGGPGTVNPVGVRPGARDTYGRQALPNLVPAGSYIQGPDDIVAPIGYGPIAEAWPQRAEKLGRHAGNFTPGQWRDRPLDGLDIAYFQATPRDQQVLMIRDDERIVLEHLHWEHARIVTNLPGVRPAVFVDQGQASISRLSVKADTLWIDTDRGLVTLTWRGQVMLDRKDEAGRVVVAMERPGKEITWAEVERVAGPGRAGPKIQADPAQSRVGGETLVGSVDRGPSMPFVREGARAQGGADLPFQAPPMMPAARVPPPIAPPVRAPQFGAPPPITPPPITPPPITPPPITPPPIVPAPIAQPPAVQPLMAGPPPIVSAPPIVAPPAFASPPQIASPPAFAGPARETVGTMAAVAAIATSAKEPPREAAPWDAPKRETRPSKPDPDPAKPDATRPFFQLLFHDPASAARIRLVPRWEGVLADLQERAIDRAIDDPKPGQDHGVAEDRREIFEVLARGEITPPSAIDDALSDAVRDDGKMATPIVLLAGELELPFDEREALGTAASIAAPLITQADDDLKKASSAAKDLSQAPGLSALPNAVEAALSRVREAFAKEKKALPPDYFDAQMDRVLLSGRRYQKREVLGGTFLRALLHAPAREGGEPSPLLCYLPADIEKKLPMWKRFEVRMIVEIHPPQDQFEAQATCMKVVAIARVGAVKAKAKPA